MKNDAPLILEKVLLDLGAYIRHAREQWRYKKVVIVGWSGGGALALLYQSQAERPSITHTPAGDPVDINGHDGHVFVGPAAEAAHGGQPVALDPNDQHWAQGTNSDGGSAVMVPSITDGQRRTCGRPRPRRRGEKVQA